MSHFNPASNPLLTPTVLAFGGVLAGGLATIAAVNRGRIDRVVESTLFQRWRTWAVIAPLFAAAVLAGPIAVAALTALAATIGLLEYASLAGLPVRQRLVCIGAGVAFVALALISPDQMTAALVIALLVSATSAVFQAPQDGFRQVGLSLLGLVYLPLLLAHAPLMVTTVEGGTGVLLAVGLAVALSDVAAFTCGKIFGRRSLAPSVSPNKTWEGAAGNLLGAATAFGIMRFAVTDLPAATQLLLPPVVAAAAVLGDLFESLLKRSSGVKDAGNWLPGFGGLLDRIDSLLFALPAAYYLVLMLD
jgi:phosphatidate cytidylyltransferase